MPSSRPPLTARVSRPLVLLTALWLSACGDDSARAGGADWLHAAAEPVRLELTLDSARAATRTIGARGGSITVTASDGTRYRLRIPRDALLGDQEIAVIPVASVGGLPLGGGGVAAVQLEPDGLRLMQPVTLSIESDHGVPVDEQVAYGWFGDGQDAHLYPLEMDPGIEMKLLHFSGYGFGRAAPNDPGRRMLQRAASYEARLSAELAEVLSAERTRQILGVGQDEADRAVDNGETHLSIEYYDAVIRPLMKAAETNERLAYCCMARYLSWIRSMALLGMMDHDEAPASPPGTPAAELQSRLAEAEASSQRIWRNAFDKAKEREIRLCREEHDFGSISRVIAMARSMALLGTLPEGELSELLDAITECITFEVEFRSIFDNRGPGVQFYYHVASRAEELKPLFGTQDGVLGSAPLEYERYDAQGSPRQALIGETMEGFWPLFGDHTVSAKGTRPGEFRVHGIAWDWNVIDSPATDCDGEDSMEKKDVAERFYILISFGAPTEITHNVPTGEGLHAGPFDSDDQAWAGHWSRAHGNERVRFPGLIVDEDDEDGGVYRIDLQPVRVGGVWRAEFKRPDPRVEGWSLAEDGYLILRHTPR